MEVQLINCPMCGVDDAVPYAARIRPNAPHFLRVRCRRCGLIYANPQATPGELLTFYQHYYDKGNFQGWKDETLAWKAAFKVSAPTSEVRHLMRHIAQPQGKRWLEIGAGLGKASYQAKLLGFDVSVTEFDSDAERFLRDEMGIAQIHLGDVLDLGLPAGHYHVILIHHVLEHVIDPMMTLRELYRLMAPGGVLFIGVPNLDSIGYRALRTTSFWARKVPDIVEGIEHTFGFTPRTLHACVEKCGFKVKQIQAMGLGGGFGPHLLRPKAFFETVFHVKMECVAVKPLNG